MRTLAILLALFVAACSQDPGDDNSKLVNNDTPNNENNANNANNENNANNGGDAGSPDTGGSDIGGPDNNSPDMAEVGGDMAEVDMGGGDDVGQPDMDDGCVDADDDGYFVECVDFTGRPGPDCDDDDPDNWTSCAACVDTDGDDYFDGCDAYDTRMGPDCDDDDGDNWTSCAFCTDQDGDQYFDDCDAYDTRMGPDCNDADGNNWTSCATCVDGDSDTYWVGCDRYGTIDGPDCDDTDADINPGENEIPNNGEDDDCDPTTEDAVCDYVPVPAVDPEPGVLAGITAEHNRWRARVDVSPLQWNATLAASAAAYAAQCIWQHDPNRSPDAGFNYVGENLYVSSGMPSNALILDSVQAWADERFDYDYGDVIGMGGPVVGHYTQVVWDDTTDVGCGFAYCPSIQGISFGGTIVACRYGPGGNYLGQTPYDFSTGVCLDLDNDDVWQGDDPDDTDRSVP